MRGWSSAAALGNAALLLALLLLAAALLLVQTHGVPRWSDPGPQRVYLAGSVVLAYGVFCVALLLWQQRRRRASGMLQVVTGGSEPPVLIAFASQTGFSEQLAWRTAESLQGAGTPVQVLALGELDAAALRGCARALFVVSTTGEGDAPDSAARFAKVMAQRLPLATLQYGLLALGDRSYASFCGFGHALDHWLRECGAQPLFDSVEVDDGDDGALRHWQHHLGLISGHTDLPDWHEPRYEAWHLNERAHLNPGSVGGPAFLLRLTPPLAAAQELRQWQAGDIAEVGPCNAAEHVAAIITALGLDPTARVSVDAESRSLGEALQCRLLPHGEQMAETLRSLRGLAPQALIEQLQPLPHREYSIACLPEQGALDLLVRQMAHSDGSLGLGSGWLTVHARINGEIRLRIRQNRSFHAPAEDVPLVLIGNGTGLAGLRAHLQARARLGRYRNWLLFGERTAAADYFLRDEIENWQRQGVLQRLDLAFSRDQPQRIYVQHRLQAAAEELRAWVAAGAAIYVCGSLDGMAPAVHDVLVTTLGQAQVDALIECGRYRRDVY